MYVCARKIQKFYNFDASLDSHRVTRFDDDDSGLDRFS